MSLLSDYEARTAWKYETVSGSFPADAALMRKVGPDGRFAPFSGSTVVIRPQRHDVKIIRLMQSFLGQQLEDRGILSEVLPESTFHMTLHDLVSPETCVSAPGDREGYRREVAESAQKAAELVDRIRASSGDLHFDMVSDRIVPMMSKSIVLLLKPRSEQDYERLMELYRPFDDIMALPYPLTPHITLAYFRPGLIDGDALGQALSRAQVGPGNAPEFTFDARSLTAQVFLDMKTYRDVQERICFVCDGGMNRSVMAATILNHLARQKNLPLRGEARSAYSNTQGRPVPEEVWETLESHGIARDTDVDHARYLSREEVPHFSGFAAMTHGGISRLGYFSLPEEQTDISRFFFGVPDPAYGEIPYEDVFRMLMGKMEVFLDAFESGYRSFMERI